MRPQKKLFFLLLAIFIISIFTGYLYFLPNPLQDDSSFDWSITIQDSDGNLLKEELSQGERKRKIVELSSISPYLINAVIATEDKNFYKHFGIDPFAIAKAAYRNIKAGKIISGASTISMQVARLKLKIYPGPKTFARKLQESLLTLRIEMHNSKSEILSYYLNNSHCGNQIEGFPMASIIYFGKDVNDLTLGEAAFLAALPSAPSRLNPYTNFEKAKEKQTIVLERMKNNSFINESEYKQALKEPIILKQYQATYKTPHFINFLKKQKIWDSHPQILKTTIDSNIQSEIEKIVSLTIKDYESKGLTQASVVVLSVPDRKILAWVGSADLNVNLGHNDGVTALRQPGSTLKPFLYAMALENALITPATLLDDSLKDYITPQGIFTPLNYSKTTHGLVFARTALASSLNIPAIKLMEQIGTQKALENLKRYGLTSLDKKHDHYGLGLALGGGEISLLELTNAYAILADSGKKKNIKFIADQNKNSEYEQVITPAAAYIISDILQDDEARFLGFGHNGTLKTEYPSYVKTGTSKNYRDNWCIGYTDKYVVGVWAGNFEGKAMENITGITGAGNIWRKTSDYLALHFSPSPLKEPQNAIKHLKILTSNGLLAGKNCTNTKTELFIANNPLPAISDCYEETNSEDTADIFSTKFKKPDILGMDEGFQIIRPKNNETFFWDEDIPEHFQQIKATAQSEPDMDELCWLVNNAPLKCQAVSGISKTNIMIKLNKGNIKLELQGLKNGNILKSKIANIKVLSKDQ